MSNEFSNAQRAEVLTQALPYIHKYYGKTIVVKYGGAAMVDEDLKQQTMGDLILLWHLGIRVVLVHGGGPEMNDLMARLGKEAKFVDGLRVTDEETVEIAQMVLAGKVNKTLVNLLEMKGGTAVGLSGVDSRLIEATPKDPALGFVGAITKVNIQLVEDLLDEGYIPVISSLGCDEDGNIYNINADTASSHIAGALSAERLILMTDIAGLLRDKDDPDSLIPELTIDEAKGLLEDSDIISGGMVPKLGCCIDAIGRGVRKVVMLDGRIPHSILMELLTDEGAGTMVKGVE